MDAFSAVVGNRRGIRSEQEEERLLAQIGVVAGVLVEDFLTKAQFHRLERISGRAFGRYKEYANRYFFMADDAPKVQALCKYLREAGVDYEIIGEE